MSPATTASMLALRDADPAADLDLGAICPDWESLRDRLIGTDSPSRRPVVRTRRRRRRLRLAVAGAVAVAALVVAGVVAWPWSNHAPASVAYGVTRQSDGSVDVRLSRTRPLTPEDLQARLRAAGVPAVVLDESSAGTCAEPAPETVPPDARIISHPSYINRAEGFVVHPGSIPAGAFLVVALPTAAQRAAILTGAPPYAGVYVTANPPTCIASRIPGPISSGGSAPASSSSTR